MPQSLSRVWLHLVFITKHRQTFLSDISFRESMFKVLSHEVEKVGCVSRWSGGWVDRVHIVFGLSRTVTIAELVEHLKTETSQWAKKPPFGMSSFSWQQGYGVFSVSESNLETVVKYVQQQDIHHQRRSFQEEFRELCQKHGIEIDERYVWD